MAKSKWRFLLFVVPALAIISISILILIQSEKPLTITDRMKSTRFCSNLPGYTPGPHALSRTVDLEPSIPLDSKGVFIIKLTNNGYVEIYFRTEEQIIKYLNELNNIDCFLTDAPPACLMGHYPGEPPGRKPCTVPTPSITPSAN